MNEEEIFQLSLDIGVAIAQSGGEIFRVEDTIKRINKSTGAKEMNVFALPSFLFATCHTSNNSIITDTRKISSENMDLAELDRINTLSRRICRKRSLAIQITKGQEYPEWARLMCCFIATASFCLYFGGTAADALFSGTAGIIISTFHLEKINLSSFSVTLISSIAAGCMAYAITLIFPNIHPDKIMIGTIMLLVPGLTVGNAMRDMISGDILSGLFELIQAITTAFAIAIGFSAAVYVFEVL